MKNLQIRWLIRRDMPEVMQIERESYSVPWDEEDFVGCLRERHCIGMVIEADLKIVGFMIYELHPKRLHVLNFAIAPECRRQGVGSAMVDRLIDKLSPERRNRIELSVRESNLTAQLFFRAKGFRATSVERGGYQDTEEDAYQFRFCLADHSLESVDDCGEGVGK